MGNLMKFIETNLKNLYIIEPELLKDERGLFYRVFCRNELKEIEHVKEIVQINQSLTKKKVLLGVCIFNIHRKQK